VAVFSSAAFGMPLYGHDFIEEDEKVPMSNHDGSDVAAARIRDAVSAMRTEAGTSDTALPRELARALSHELRTPLSAMAGWVHLLESGALDAAGTKRAIAKLRGNIDEQVRTIERYLGNTSEGPRS